MWILILLFGLSCLVVGWTCFGYYLWLGLKALFLPRPCAKADGAEFPLLSVVVPCYNEQEQIVEKYRDLCAQNYPRERLEVVFADGGSTDETVARLEEASGDDPTVRIERCPRSGKINQLNHVLPSLKGSIVINTDVDGRMDPSAISALVTEFRRGNDIAVVGAYVFPADTIPVDQYYWAAQNRGRFLESDAGTSSIVIAACYAFRRSLISAFPDDVVADDIYVAFEANARSLRTIYSRQAVVAEVRGPLTRGEFFAHKFRKSNAFLREALRFLYRLPEMPAWWKMAYATKVAQLLLLPWAGLAFLLIGGSLVTLGRCDVVLMGIAALVILLAVTSTVFRCAPLPGDAPKNIRFPTMLRCYIYSNLILFATGISYPFCRQTSSYARLCGTGKGTAPGEGGAQPDP